MKTLVIVEVDGVLDRAPKAAAVAKQALVQPDWSLAIVTGRPHDRASETLQYLAARIKISQYPKTSPTYWCHGALPSDTVSNKLRSMNSLLRQHHGIERVVVYESSKAALEAYATALAGRESPRSWTLWLVEPPAVNKTAAIPTAFRSSAVHETSPGEDR